LKPIKCGSYRKVNAMTIEEILSKEENQTFDWKSINISPKDLAIPIVAFANADGGDIAIGITDKTRRIEDIDFETKKLNELLRVPFDFCNPTIKVGIEKFRVLMKRDERIMYL
jgi:ATP-dependent DNA helicase RecG